MYRPPGPHQEDYISYPDPSFDKLPHPTPTNANDYRFPPTSTPTQNQVQTQTTPAYTHPQPGVLIEDAPPRSLSAATNFASWARSLPSPPPFAADGNSGRREGRGGRGRGGQGGTRSPSSGGHATVMAGFGPPNTRPEEAGVEDPRSPTRPNAYTHAGWDLDQTGMGLTGLSSGAIDEIFDVGLCPQMQMQMQMVGKTRSDGVGMGVPAVKIFQEQESMNGGSGLNCTDVKGMDFLSTGPLAMPESESASTTPPLMISTPAPYAMAGNPEPDPSSLSVASHIVQAQTRLQQQLQPLRQLGRGGPPLQPVGLPSQLESTYPSGSGSGFSSEPAVPLLPTNRGDVYGWDDSTLPVTTPARAQGELDVPAYVQHEARSSSTASGKDAGTEVEIPPNVTRSSNQGVETKTRTGFEEDKPFEPFPHGLYGVKSWKAAVVDVPPGSGAPKAPSEVYGVDVGPSGLVMPEMVPESVAPAAEGGRGPLTNGRLMADETLSTPVPYHHLEDLFQDATGWDNQTTRDSQISRGDSGFTSSDYTVSDYHAVITPATSDQGGSGLYGWANDALAGGWDDPAMMYQLAMLQASKGKGESVSFGGKLSACQCQLHDIRADCEIGLAM